jgi:hypothetical protein
MLKEKGTNMGDKGKKDWGKRDEQKKGKLTIKEKRKQKKDKLKPIELISALTTKKRQGS